MSKTDETFAIRPDIMWRRLGSEIVTMDLKTRNYHVLNEAAACIFEQSTGKNTVETVAKKLAERLNINEELALEDTLETIDGMVKLGLLVDKDTAKEGAKEGHVKPAIRTITEEDLKESVGQEVGELALRTY